MLQFHAIFSNNDCNNWTSPLDTHFSTFIVWWPCTKITGDTAVKRKKNGVELLKIEKMIPFDINF